MRLNKGIIWVTMVFILWLTGCVNHSPVKTAGVGGDEDKLIVYSDGTMIFRNRIYNEEDVVIYEDGFGGEKAAVKMLVPLHPDFYRDSIIVERKTSAGSPE